MSGVTAPSCGGMATYYNRKLDELKVYRVDSKQPLVYIQGFSSKWRGSSEMSIELLVWLSVNYHEYMVQAV